MFAPRGAGLPALARLPRAPLTRALARLGPALLLALAVLPAARPAAAEPCRRLWRAGTVVKGQVRICPGRYRIPDPGEQGVLVVGESGTSIDLSNVLLESGDSLIWELTGAGIVSQDMNDVSIVGGAIRGFRHGIRLEGGSGHRVSRIDLSGTREERRRSSDSQLDMRDWLDIARPDVFERYGAGLVLKRVRDATVTGVVAQGSQNGIALVDVRDSYLADNQLAGNSGWGIHLWRSSRNVIVRNVARESVRCETAAYSVGCGSAAILLRERSDSNLIADNDLTYSGDGFFLTGQVPLGPSVGNVVARNDATGALHSAFVATWSSGTTFIDNRADSAAIGFQLGYSTATIVRGNRILGARQAGILVQHGADIALAGNTIIGGQVGIRVFAPDTAGPPSRGYRIDDNLVSEAIEALSLERTTQTKVRGNLFDMVGDALVVDEAGAATEVAGNFFLRARGLYIDAPKLSAGGNFWGTFNLDAAARKVRGTVILEPWRPAAAGGF